MSRKRFQSAMGELEVCGRALVLTDHAALPELDVSGRTLRFTDQAAV